MKIITFKQFLSESFKNENLSFYIINTLFHDRHITELYNTLKPYFPIDHQDREKLAKVCEVCHVKTNVIVESFPAHEDFALTILNKYFTSTNNVEEMTNFLLDQCKVKQNSNIIQNVYNGFHSRFN